MSLPEISAHRPGTPAKDYLHLATDTVIEIGLTANRLKIYEDGNRSQNVMDLKTAVAIANVLKIKPEDLIDDV